MADARSVIIPPEDVRKLADKAAEYVAKNGLPFEELLNKESEGNTKFCFLQHTNPYRPYYDQKVIEFSKGLITKLDEPHQKFTATSMKEPNGMLNTDKELKAPTPDQFSYAHPSVGSLEMDIIKHAAQFVAENGQRFLIALTEREKSNPQFEFLKPTHSLFPFFTTLIDSYSTLLNMYKNKKTDPLKLKLMTNVADKHAIFTRSGQRFEYENMQKQMKKKRDEVEEEERNKMAMIDWNDFVVVQTIDFKDDDNLPAPRDLSQAEKANKILFNKNNINPEFAFLLEPQNFQANPTTSSVDHHPSSRNLDSKKDEIESNPFKTPSIGDMPQRTPSMPPKSMIPSFLQKPAGIGAGPGPMQIPNFGPNPNSNRYSDSSDDVTLNVRLGGDGLDMGQLKDKVVTLKVNTRDSVEQLKQRVLEQVGVQGRGYKLRHTSYDLLDDAKPLSSYNFLNGTSLELSSAKRVKGE